MLYDENPTILSKNEYSIMMVFNGYGFSVNKGDTVAVLIDDDAGSIRASMPKLKHLTFQEFYDCVIKDEDYGGPYGYSFSGELFSICGIGQDA